MNDQSKPQKEHFFEDSLPEDLLDREAEVETLNNLLFGDPVQIDGRRPGEAIAVCGGWGTGKTWLVKKWRKQLLENKQARVVYLSAWGKRLRR